MRFRLAIVSSGIAALVAGSVLQGQGTTLRYKWQKGDEVRYRLTQQGTTSMSGVPGAGDMTVEQNFVQVMRMAVQDVGADGNATVRQTFESVRMEMGMPDGKMVFDSTSPTKPDNPMAAAMASTMGGMVGESITVNMRPTGSVTKVEGMVPILEKIMKAVPQDPMTAQALNQMKSGMNDEAMRSTLEQSFAVFPDRALNIGDTWTSEGTLQNPMAGPMTSIRTATLKSLDTVNGVPVARIALTLATKQGSAPSPNAVGMTITINDMKSEGELLFDVAKGRVQKMVMKSEMPMTMSMPGPDGNGINVQSLVRTTMTMDLVEQ